MFHTVRWESRKFVCQHFGWFTGSPVHAMTIRALSTNNVRYQHLPTTSFRAVGFLLSLQVFGYVTVWNQPTNQPIVSFPLLAGRHSTNEWYHQRWLVRAIDQPSGIPRPTPKRWSTHCQNTFWVAELRTSFRESEIGQTIFKTWWIAQNGSCHKAILMRLSFILKLDWFPWV